MHVLLVARMFGDYNLLIYNSLPFHFLVRGGAFVTLISVRPGLTSRSGV